MIEVNYSEKAAKQLRKIFKTNSNDAKRIFEGIENYANYPELKHDIKQLKGKWGDFKRLRIADYRVIFDNENNIMLIYEIKFRKDAYND